MLRDLAESGGNGLECVVEGRKFPEESGSEI